MTKLAEQSDMDSAAKTRFFKKWYIVIRCLIHAQECTLLDLVQFSSSVVDFFFFFFFGAQVLERGAAFEAWFEKDNPHWKYLMDIRGGAYSHEQLLSAASKRVRKKTREAKKNNKKKNKKKTEEVKNRNLPKTNLNYASNTLTTDGVVLVARPCGERAQDVQFARQVTGILNHIFARLVSASSEEFKQLFVRPHKPSKK